MTGWRSRRKFRRRAARKGEGRKRFADSGAFSGEVLRSVSFFSIDEHVRRFGEGAILALRRWVAGCLAFALIGCAGPNSGRRRDDRPNPARIVVRDRLAREAQAALDRDDPRRALTILRALVAEAPRSAEAHQKLGRVLIKLGRYEEARDEETIALTIDPDYVDALIALGELDALRGRYREAIRRFDSAIELDPNRSEAHLNEAKALEALGRTDDALAAYFRVLELDPASSAAALRVASIQIGRDREDQALARLEQVLERSPEDAEARALRGLARLRLRQIPGAVADFEFASRRLPDRPDVFYHLALAYEAARSLGPALQAAERAARLAPRDPAAVALAKRLRK